MEKLYDLGKRFERLLYSSVFVVIISFVFYSLSMAIIQDFKKSKLDVYDQILTELNYNYSAYQEAEKLSGYFYSYRQKSVSDPYSNVEGKTKEEIETAKSEMKKENTVREKLNLPKLTEAKIGYDQDLYDARQLQYLSKLVDVNELRAKLHIEKALNEISASETFQTLIGRLISKYASKDYELSAYFRNAFREKPDLASFASMLTKDSAEIGNVKIKIFDVEAPMQFPFSLGEMKSNISLYNVQKMGMAIYPVFLVFWLGSICMTRNREIYFLLKTKLVPYAYPHILNIFQFTDARYENETVKNQNLNLILLGDKKAIKRHESFAFLLFLCRIFLGCGLLLVITLPAYWGFANVVFTSYSQTGLAQLSILLICFLINSLQIVFFGFSESKVVKKYFYLNS
ncbi:hypothetical protein [Pantoea agglomerans]|uniref:hypothetical protein n=1 Tax=Enterobacter agglomerans TaxID=549 RepID=UPI0028A09BF1|nr:hypothetical protein [Pantoea agglomerans]WNK42649.1 hypothetical protein RM160_23370 [Pantoea agglomerans]